MANDLVEAFVLKNVESGVKASHSPLLYCPACAGEYPLTFELCPADGIRLTDRKPISKLRNRAGSIPSPAKEQISEPVPEVLTEEKELLEPPEEFIQETPVDEEFSPPAESNVRGYEVVDETLEPPFPEESIEETRPDSLRIAAFLILIGLIVFGLIAVYTLFVGVRRNPTPQPAGVTGKIEEPETVSPLITTPEEARDFVEEETATADSKDSNQQGQIAQTQEPAETRPSQVESSVSKLAGKEQRSAQMPGNVGAEDKTHSPQTQPRRVIDVSAPVPSEATDGRVWADLIRVRPRQSSSGYRYDLTFNLRERAGRALRWDRLTISALSASGERHNQALGFPYFLGAGGMLTFTVSLEMPGARESDWRGRVVCIASGEDTTGKRVRASFGATVAPW